MDAKSKVLIVAALLSCISSAPLIAKEASDRDRKLMSLEVANYIHDPYGSNSHPHAFGGSSTVEIGAAAVEGHYALADWRSADGKHWGQIAFFYMCDHWNVGPITNERRMRPKEILTMPRAIPSETVPTKLIAEVEELEARHIAFIPLPHPRLGC